MAAKKSENFQVKANRTRGFTDYLRVDKTPEEQLAAAEAWLARRDPWDEIKVKK